jgi:hypothetical protein
MLSARFTPTQSEGFWSLIKRGVMGWQDSKHCIPNDRHQTRALPQKG